MATAPRTTAGSLAGLLSGASLPVALTIAMVVIGLAALVPLVQSSGATSTAGTVRALEEEKVDWQARLRELELEVADLGSLDRIEKEARHRFRMAAPTEVHFITVDVPAPEERKLPSRYLPPERGSRDGGSSLWDDLFGWLPLP